MSMSPTEYEIAEAAYQRHEEQINDFLRGEWEREEAARAEFEETRRYEAWCEANDYDPAGAMDAYVAYLEGFFPED